MFGIEKYMGFILVGILLNLTPGSDTIYILTRSVAQGRKAGIASVLEEQVPEKGAAVGVDSHV